jgi:hypothetical protein
MKMKTLRLDGERAAGSVSQIPAASAGLPVLPVLSRLANDKGVFKPRSLSNRQLAELELADDLAKLRRIDLLR